MELRKKWTNWRPNPWLIVGVLSVVGALNYLDRMMITTMRSSIMSSIPMTEAEFGLLSAAFLWTYGVCSPFAGFLADRFSRRQVIIGSFLFWSLVTWLTSYADSYNDLLVTRILMGVSEAFYIPAALALISDYHSSRTRSLATGIHMAGITVGQSFGFAGGVLADQYSWNFAFSFFGIAGVFYSILLILVLKDKPNAIPQKNPTPLKFSQIVAYLAGKKNYLLALAYWGLLGVVGWVFAGWLPTFYKEQFHLSQGQAGIYATGYFYIASFVGVLVGGYWADRWSRRNPRARVLFPAIGLFIAVPGVFFASMSTSLPLTIACFMVYAFNRAFTDSNMMPILYMIIDKRYLATGYGILNMFSCIIGGIGLYMGGVLRDANVQLEMVFQVASGILVLCAVLLSLIKVSGHEKI